MIDISNLPFASKAVLYIGFGLGIASFVLFLRYPIILILMKYSPDYREFIKRTIARNNQKKHSYHEKNYLRNGKSP